MKKWAKVILTIAIAFFVFMVNGSGEDSRVSGQLKVHFIDVGQADAIVIEADSGETMLIDAGNNADSDLVISYIEALGIDRIDVLVGTHPHEDHIGGMDDVINHFDIGDIYMPKVSHTSKTYEDVLVAIKDKGLKVTSPKPGTTFDLGSAQCRVLSPIGSDYSDLNDYSITIRLTYGQNSFLFMGDAEKLVEDEILEEGYSVRADVLKLGHHGSEYSSSEDFLDAVNPKYGVISVGVDNTYGHPSERTLERLDNRGIEVYRTDELGTIVATSDGKDVTFTHH